MSNAPRFRDRFRRHLQQALPSRSTSRSRSRPQTAVDGSTNANPPQVLAQASTPEPDQTGSHEGPTPAIVISDAQQGNKGSNVVPADPGVVSQRPIAQRLWDDAFEAVRASTKHADIYAALTDELQPSVGQDVQKISQVEAFKALVESVGVDLGDRTKQSQPRRFLREATAVVNKFVSVGDVAVNFDPVHAALPWAAVRFILVNVTAGIELDDKILEGLALITLLFARCSLYTELYLALPPNGEDHLAAVAENSFAEIGRKALGQALVNIYSYALLFMGQMIYGKSRNPVSRGVNAIFDMPELNAHLQSLKDAEKTLVQAAGDCDKISHHDAWSSVINDISDLQVMTQHAFDYMRGDQLRDRLSPVEGAMFNHIDNHNIQLCHPETRVELLSQVRDWAKGEDQPPIFWLEGAAGTGKSTISRTVAQQSEDQSLFVVTFFFKRGGGDRDHGRRFFTTLAYQIARKIPWWHQDISDALTADPSIATRHISEQFGKLIRGPLAREEGRATGSLMSSKKTVVVIDALDECERNDIRIIIPLLLSTKLRCFITTRPDYNVKSFLGAEDPHVLRILHRIAENTARSDLRVYMKSEIEQFRILHNREMDGDDELVLPQHWPGERVLSSLAQIAFPLFIVAATLCRMLRDPDWALSPEEKIQSFLKEWKAGQTPVANIYTQILDRIKNADPERLLGATGHSFRVILGSIVLIFDPLNAKCLSNLLSFSDMKGFNKTTLLSRLVPLRAVVDVAEPETLIKAFHLSFRDYLVDSRTPECFRIDEKKGHLGLANMCRQILLEKLKPNICDIEPGASRIDVDETLVHERLTPELRYAVLHWVEHLQASGSYLQDDDAFHRLLKTKFPMWVEALSLLSRMPESLRQIRLLQGLADPSSGTLASDFLHDASRFILHFRQIIEDAPLQVYHSGLVFAPMQSVIRQQFRDLDCPGWTLETPPVVGQHWGSHLLTIEPEYYPRLIASKVSVDGKLAQVRRGPSLHVQVLELATGDKFPTIHLATDDLFKRLAFSLDNRLAIATGHRIIIWNIDNGLHLQSIPTSATHSVDSMAFSADGSYISIYSPHEKEATMYNLQTGRPTLRYQADNGVFSGKSTWLAIPRSRSVELVQWKPMSQFSTQEIQFDDEPIKSRYVTFSPNERLLGVLGSLHIFVWDIEKRKEVGRCRVTAFAGLALSDNQLVICYDAGLVDVFKLDGDGHQWLSTGFQRLASYEISICQKHNLFIRVTPDDGTTMVWDFALLGTDPRPEAVLMSRDKAKLGCHGEYFAAVTDQELWVWDMQRGERIATFPEPWTFTLAAHQPLLGFLSNADENEITIVNLNDNYAKSKFKANHDSVSLLAFSEDGSKLVLRSQSVLDNIYDDAPYVVQVWNIATKTCEWSVQAKFKASSAVISGTKIALQSPEYPHPAMIFDMSLPQVPRPAHIGIPMTSGHLDLGFPRTTSPYSNHLARIGYFQSVLGAAIQANSDLWTELSDSFSCRVHSVKGMGNIGGDIDKLKKEQLGGIISAFRDLFPQEHHITDGWIMRGKTKLVCLPTNYLPSMAAWTFGRSIVIATEPGELHFYRFKDTGGSTDS